MHVRRMSRAGSRQQEESRWPLVLAPLYPFFAGCWGGYGEDLRLITEASTMYLAARDEDARIHTWMAD